MMNNSKAEIRKKCIEEFVKFGWTVKKNYRVFYEDSKSIVVDLALIGKAKVTDPIDYCSDKLDFEINFVSESEAILGYVLIVNIENDDDIREFKERVTILLSKIKPKVLFITEGNVYETYFNGIYCDTLLVPIKADNLEQSIRIMSYAKKLGKGN